MQGTWKIFRHVLQLLWLHRWYIQTILISADAGQKLRNALGKHRQGNNRAFDVGERVWFWRDARQADCAPHHARESNAPRVWSTIWGSLLLPRVAAGPCEVSLSFELGTNEYSPELLPAQTGMTVPIAPDTANSPGDEAHLTPGAEAEVPRLVSVGPSGHS